MTLRDQTLVSEHFTLREFLRSDAAARMGKPIVAPPEIFANLRRLCELVLEPIRAELGRPITILSGYRPLWVNKLVGGSSTSEHVDGRAADFEVPGMTDLEVCQRIAGILDRLPVNQLIYEFPPNGWTHVSVCRGDAAPKRQVITARSIKGATHYTTGLTA